MGWYVGLSLITLRDEVNKSAPNRSKRSDGTIGDAAHSSRQSDHNPCPCHGAVCAIDITHDPTGGFNSYSFAEWLRQRCAWEQEHRVKYIISNRKIASPKSGWSWRQYSGVNPHDKHVHVSVNHGPAFFDNRGTWEWHKTSPTPPSGGTFVVELNKTLLTPANRDEVRGNGDVLLVQFISLGLYEYSGHEDFNVGKPDADYGPRTQKAVALMQSLNNLEVDSKCGPVTWGAILNKDGK